MSRNETANASTPTYTMGYGPEFRKPLMHVAPVTRVCHQMLRLRLGRGNG